MKLHFLFRQLRSADPGNEGSNGNTDTSAATADTTPKEGASSTPEQSTTDTSNATATDATKQAEGTSESLQTATLMKEILGTLKELKNPKPEEPKAEDKQPEKVEEPKVEKPEAHSIPPALEAALRTQFINLAKVPEELKSLLPSDLEGTVSMINSEAFTKLVTKLSTPTAPQPSPDKGADPPKADSKQGTPKPKGTVDLSELDSLMKDALSL